jgi:hypothetical protein
MTRRSSGSSYESGNLVEGVLFTIRHLAIYCGSTSIPVTVA